MQGVSIVSIRWEGVQGGRLSVSRVGGGKGEGQLSLRPVGTLVVRQRMKKACAVQSGRALPMGRCASPPCFRSKHIRLSLSFAYI